MQDNFTGHGRGGEGRVVVGRGEWQQKEVDLQKMGGEGGGGWMGGGVDVEWKRRAAV